MHAAYYLLDAKGGEGKMSRMLGCKSPDSLLDGPL